MVKEIQLTQGKVALVDDADYEYLSQWKWHAQLIKGRWYARRSIRKGFPKQISLSMHQVILNTPNGMESDHKNGNGLDNQRHNLRVCTKYKNMYNQNIQTRSKSSKFKGVYWSKKYRKWVAQIRVNHKAIWLGQFNSEIEAANTYNMAAKRIFGEFAKLNITEVEKMSEKLCTDCGHPISEHSNVLGCCLICVSCNRTPADLQPSIAQRHKRNLKKLLQVHCLTKREWQN